MIKLSMQSVPIRSWWGVLDTTLCDIVCCQWLVTGWWFSPGTPVSPTNKTDCHDITNIVESGVKHHNPNPRLTLNLICNCVNKNGLSMQHKGPVIHNSNLMCTVYFIDKISLSIRSQPQQPPNKINIKIIGI
jgi:hypothetical protein